MFDWSMSGSLKDIQPEAIWLMTFWLEQQKGNTKEGATTWADHALEQYKKNFPQETTNEDT